jgi:hypothetical protein
LNLIRSLSFETLPSKSLISSTTRALFTSPLSFGLVKKTRPHRSLAAGETIEEQYDGNLNNIDIGTEQHLKIDMEILFNETPHGKGGGYDDAQSVVTMMTGVTNATSAIQDALAPTNGNRRKQHRHRRRRQHERDHCQQIRQYLDLQQQQQQPTNPSRQLCLRTTDGSKQSESVTTKKLNNNQYAITRFRLPSPVKRISQLWPSSEEKEYQDKMNTKTRFRRNTLVQANLQREDLAAKDSESFRDK